MKFSIQGDGEAVVISCKTENVVVPETGRLFAEYQIRLISNDFENDVLLNKPGEEDLVTFIAKRFDIKWSPFFGKALTKTTSNLIEDMLIDGYMLNIAKVKGDLVFRLINIEKNEVRLLSVKEFEQIFIDKLKKTAKNPEKIDEMIRQYEEFYKETSDGFKR